jgi:uroporphyrinogen decarboxylase
VLSGRGGCGQAYRDLAKRHPSFRERSENTELIVDITMQPFRSFQPDGIILFRRARNPPLPHTHTFLHLASCTRPLSHGCCVRSDILTPLPAFGIDFDIDDDKGPLLDKPITSKEGVRPPRASCLNLLGASLRAERAIVSASSWIHLFHMQWSSG